jgi:hypothetical protein
MGNTEGKPKPLKQSSEIDLLKKETSEMSGTLYSPFPLPSESYSSSANMEDCATGK